MINCDLPGHREIQYSTGAGYTTAQIEGWLPFKEYLAALTAELPNSWSVSYDETADRVKFTPGTGSLALILESDSMALTLGASSTTISSMTTETSLTNAPRGLTPIDHLHIADPVSGNKPDLRVFRHGRAHSVSYGSAKNYSVNVRFDSADFERLQEGPCGVGKVRIGDYTASSAYGPANVGGYLDGYILRQRDLTLENIEVNIGGSSAFVVVAPNTAHDSAADPSDVFWGHLDRGYSLNYFATIEGVPFRFVEKEVGFSSGDYTDSASLIIDTSQKVQHKIDRIKGLAAASGVTIGILDPENELRIFERASVQISIDSDVAYNDTTIDLSSDSTNFGTSGTVYLGKEALKFTGNTGPSGSPANQLSGITRPFGEGYDYNNKTGQKFRTVTNRKRVWDGCEVSLRAMLLDPYGNAVGTTYTDDYQRKVFSGEVAGIPGYDNGVWILQTKDLIRRLTRKIGQGASGKTQPTAQQAQIGITGLGLNDFSSVWVRTDTSDRLQLAIDSIDPYGAFETTTLVINVTGMGLPTYHTIGEAFQKLFDTILAVSMPNTNLVDDQIAIVHNVDQYQTDDIGNIRVAFTISAQSGAFYSILSIRVGPVAQPSAFTAPMWFTESLFFWDSPSQSTSLDQTLFVTPGIRGTDVGLVVVKQPPNTSAILGSFENQGFAVLEGDNARNELIRYDGADTSSIPNHVILSNVQRNLLGQSVNIFKGKREIRQAYRTYNDQTAFDESIGSLAAQVLESSGNSKERGIFDDLPRGFGYALKASEHVYDDGATLQDPSKTITGAFPEDMDLILTGGLSFVEYFGGLAAAAQKSFAWVRSGTGLRIGVVNTTTSGNEEEFTITDEDLLAGNSASIQRVSSGPNEVIVTQAESPLFQAKNQYTYRVIEDMLARGTVSEKASLYGMKESVFYDKAESLAIALVNHGSSEVAYRLRVKPSRDWLAGQLVRVEVTHPALYDWKNNSDGLSDVARIVEVSRDLSSGECEIVILAGAVQYYPALCKAALVTNYNLSGSDGILTLSDASILEPSDVVRVYNPGTTIAEEKRVLAVDLSTNEVTISGLLSFIPTNNYTTASYPLDTNANISPRQENHAHVDDGGSYL